VRNRNISHTGEKEFGGVGHGRRAASRSGRRRDPGGCAFGGGLILFQCGLASGTRLADRQALALCESADRHRGREKILGRYPGAQTINILCHGIVGYLNSHRYSLPETSTKNGGALRRRSACAAPLGSWKGQAWGMGGIARLAAIPFGARTCGVQRAVLSGRGCGPRSGPPVHSGRLHSPFWACASS
jgi:hypothetical protein